MHHRGGGVEAGGVLSNIQGRPGKRRHPYSSHFMSRFHKRGLWESKIIGPATSPSMGKAEVGTAREQDTLDISVTCHLEKCRQVI